MILTIDQLERRDQIMGWFQSSPQATPKQKRAKQAKLNRAAINHNKTLKAMNAANKAAKKKK